MKRYDPVAGPTIQQAARALVQKANEINEDVVGNFNDIDMIAHPGDDPLDIENNYHFLHKLREV